MNHEKFLNLRSQYPNFYYHSLNVTEEKEYYQITYFFSIPLLAEFHPSIKIYKEKIVNQNKDYIDSIIKNNAEKANYYAMKTLRKVQKKVGFPERIS